MAAFKAAFFVKRKDPRYNTTGECDCFGIFIRVDIS